MNACEYLARVGFDALLGEPTPPCNPDDPESVKAAHLIDHDRVWDVLMSRPAERIPKRDGVKWIRRITWPDRVPALKVWAGRVKLDLIIDSHQYKRRPDERDIFRFRRTKQGASGIDSLACPTNLEAGFSLDLHKMKVEQRPAMELLAIVGMEAVPAVSYSHREVGFYHDGALWKFPIEKRNQWYSRWGDVERVGEKVYY